MNNKRQRKGQLRHVVQLNVFVTNVILRSSVPVIQNLFNDLAI